MPSQTALCPPARIEDPESLRIEEHTRLVMSEQMILSVESSAITVGMWASQRLLCGRPLRGVKINIISLFRSGRARSCFSKLLTTWKQCLLIVDELLVLLKVFLVPLSRY